MSAKAAAKAVAAQASLAASAAPLPPPMPQLAPKPSAPATTATANNEKKATNAPSAESTEGSFSGPPPGHEPPPTTTATTVPIPKENSEAQFDPSATAPLPEGWQEVKQDNGGPNYFYHTRTRMSRWQKPDPVRTNSFHRDSSSRTFSTTFSLGLSSSSSSFQMDCHLCFTLA
jgi:hypothetical protein